MKLHNRILSFLYIVLCLSLSSLCFSFDTTVPGLGQTDFSFTETAIYRYFTDEDYVEKAEEGEDNEFINRLNLRITNRDYVLGLRFDVDLNTARDEEYRLEKKFFQVNKKKFSLELGDYYYSFGRGIVLNVVKSFEDEGSEYQIEKTILGGRFSYHGQSISGTVLGGVIEDYQTEQEDTIGGGCFSATLMEKITVGLNALGIKFPDDDLRGEYAMYEQGIIGSITVDIPSLSEYSSLYFEIAGEHLGIRDDIDDDDLQGWAAYLMTVAYLGNWIVQVEGKRTDDLRFPYSSPPLLEPEEISILAEQFVLETTDVSGVRVRLDYTFPESGTIVYGVYGYIDDSPEDDFFFGNYYRYTNEYYIGIDSYLANNIHILSNVGYRYERSSFLSSTEYSGYTPHAYFSSKIPFTEKQSIEVVANWKKFTEDSRLSADPDPYEFSRQEYSLAYHYSPVFALIGTYEYFDDKRAMASTPGFDPDKTDFYSATLQIHPIQDLYLKLFYGATPGGIKCSSGVCKAFPPFEGLRAEMVVRF